MVTYFITYDVTDAAGNKAVQLLRKITVEAADTPDITAPVITLKGESETIVAQGSSYTDPGVNATDDRDGDLTDKVVVAGDQVDTFVPGVYNITYNLTDAAGNQAEEVVRKVTVQAADILPPLLSLKGQATVYITQGDVYTDAGATALDERDGDISSSIVVAGADFDANVPDEYIVTYNVADAAGNKAAELTRKVVVDPLPPPKFSIASIQKDGAKVIVTISEPEGGEYDHWRVSLDQPLSETGIAGGLKVANGLSYTFENVSAGNHVVYAGLANDEDEICMAIRSLLHLLS